MVGAFPAVAWNARRKGRLRLVIAYILFALTGFVFGWALPGKSAYIVPIVIPLLIALPTALKQGVDGRFVADLILALGLTILGIVAGRIVASRTDSGVAEPADEKRKTTAEA
jgi:hypothetical protein